MTKNSACEIFKMENQKVKEKEEDKGIYSDKYIDYDLDKVITENYNHIPKIG